MTVRPVLLAIRELRERYQEGKLSEVAVGLGWLMSLGGADAGRGGGGVEAGPDPYDALRWREGGESRVVFIIGVVGGVSWGVVGVAGWSTIASPGETSKGVSWLVLLLLAEPATSSVDMVGEQRQVRERVLGRRERIDAETEDDSPLQVGTSAHGLGRLRSSRSDGIRDFVQGQ